MTAISVLCWRGSQNPGACWPASSAESVSLMFSENPYLKKKKQERKGRREGRREGGKEEGKEGGVQAGRKRDTRHCPLSFTRTCTHTNLYT